MMTLEKLTVFLIQFAPSHSKVLEFFWSSASLGPRGKARRAKHPFFCCFRILAIVWSCLVSSSSSTSMLFLPDMNHENKQYQGVPIHSDDEHWSQFSNFLDSLRQDPARANTEWAWRWNCTLRWHRNHIGGCRYAVRNQPPEMPATQPVTIKMPLAVTPWSTHPHFAVHNRLNFAGGVQQAASSSTITVPPVAVTVLLPQGMTPMGPIGQAAAPCVSDSAPVSDDRPGRLIQSASCVSDDSAPVSDDRPGRTKRTHPKPNLLIH